MPAYDSEIELGARYRDDQTGFEGTAIYITFHQHSCERVAIEGKAEGGDIKAYEFDAVRLSLVEPPQKKWRNPGTGANAIPVRSTGRRS